MPHAVALAGMALHAGVMTSVVLAPWGGPLVLEQDGVRVRLDALEVSRADRGVQVTGAGGRVRVDLVEHLLAALEGLGVRRGVRVVVRGGEIPLLDGGAGRFARALRDIGVDSTPCALRVARCASFTLGESRYDLIPGDAVRVEVDVRFAHALVVVQKACWQGDPEDFVTRIAPARTFGFLHEARELRAAGRARGVDPSSVIVLGPAGSTLSHPPPAPDECVRHKLLDLLGDFALHGGVPRGTLVAHRPGHSATHAMVAQALREGVIAGGSG